MLGRNSRFTLVLFSLVASQGSKHRFSVGYRSVVESLLTFTRSRLMVNLFASVWARSEHPTFSMKHTK